MRDLLHETADLAADFLESLPELAGQAGDPNLGQQLVDERRGR